MDRIEMSCFGAERFWCLQSSHHANNYFHSCVLCAGIVKMEAKNSICQLIRGWDLYSTKRTWKTLSEFPNVSKTVLYVFEREGTV